MDEKKKNFKTLWEILSPVFNPKKSKSQERNKQNNKGKVFTGDKEISVFVEKEKRMDNSWFSPKYNRAKTMCFPCVYPNALENTCGAFGHVGQ